MSKIEWTEKTWNPVVGCSVTSPGCKNCYAMKMAGRLEAMTEKSGHADHYLGTTKKVNDKTVWTAKIGVAPDAVFEQPLRRKKPTTYFVNSMGDLFHPNVPIAEIDRVFAVMALSPQHKFQILTKYPERMRDHVKRYETDEWADLYAMDMLWGMIKDFEHGKRRDELEHLLDYENEETGLCSKPDLWPHVLLGASVEDQKRADERRDYLKEVSEMCWKTFVSYEPALGPVNWSGWDFLDWLIVGGESGPNARPVHPDWARNARGYCQINEIAFFFKQWGKYLPHGQLSSHGSHAIFYDVEPTKLDDGHLTYAAGKKAAGRLLDGVEHNEQIDWP